MIGRYRAHLETELLKQEQTFKFVLVDKDKTIARLEEELRYLRAKCERYELLLLPRLNPAVPSQRPKTKEVEMEGETSWHAYLQRYVKEQEELERQEQLKKGKPNGVHVEGRATVHESTGNDASRPDGGQQQASGSQGNRTE